MHESFQRLIQAAERAKLKDLRPTPLGEAVGESPQTITNWQARGISIPGAVKAEQAFDCRAVWLLYGSGPPGGRSSAEPPAPQATPTAPRMSPAPVQASAAGIGSLPAAS